MSETPDVKQINSMIAATVGRRITYQELIA